MLVSNLQRFLQLLVPPLSAAGINASAEKSVTASLESVATALEPFKELSTDQLTDLLRVAREYRETGQIPDWVVSKNGKPPKAPRAPKAPKMTPAQAVAKLRDVQARSPHLEPSQIAQEVQELAGMSIKDLQAVQNDYLGATAGKKKDELLAALKKKIDDFRESQERVAGIRLF